MSHRVSKISCCLLLAMVLPLATEARVVINEIFYRADTVPDLEFIELHNAGDDAVDLTGWKFSKGLKFTFPAGATLEAGGFALLCRNEAVLRGQFPGPLTVLGTFASKLSNHGERLELTDARGRVVDTVKYQD